METVRAGDAEDLLRLQAVNDRRRLERLGGSRTQSDCPERGDDRKHHGRCLHGSPPVQWKHTFAAPRTTTHVL
jgi:hypothetical protein